MQGQVSSTQNKKEHVCKDWLKWRKQKSYVRVVTSVVLQSLPTSLWDKRKNKTECMFLLPVRWDIFHNWTVWLGSLCLLYSFYNSYRVASRWIVIMCRCRIHSVWWTLNLQYVRIWCIVTPKDMSIVINKCLH